MHAKLLQSYPTLWDPLDCSQPGSSVHGILQARILEYLKLLIFLPAILIPACVSSSPGFLMMYSAYKLNKQGDNTQPWRIPFPIWNQSVVPCPVLTVASWPAYRFLKRQIRCSGIPISFRFFQMMLWKCYTQYASTFGKLSSGHRTGKSQFLFQSQRKKMPKNA